MTDSRLVRHDRKAQQGISRNARQIARLAGAAQVSHYFAESRSPNARRGGVQIRNHVRKDPRGIGSETDAQSPIMGHFPFPRGTVFQFPYPESATRKWS